MELFLVFSRMQCAHNIALFHTMQQRRRQSSRMRNNEPMMQRNHPKSREGGLNKGSCLGAKWGLGSDPPTGRRLPLCSSGAAGCPGDPAAQWIHPRSACSGKDIPGAAAGDPEGRRLTRRNAVTPAGLRCTLSFIGGRREICGENLFFYHSFLLFFVLHLLVSKVSSILVHKEKGVGRSFRSVSEKMPQISGVLWALRENVIRLFRRHGVWGKIWRRADVAGSFEASHVMQVAKMRFHLCLRDIWQFAKGEWGLNIMLFSQLIPGIGTSEKSTSTSGKSTLTSTGDPKPPIKQARFLHTQLLFSFIWLVCCFCPSVPFL